MSEELLNNLTDAQKAVRITEAEQTIVEADKKIEIAKALSKMKNSDEFKLVVDEQYFVEYAQEIFKEMTNPPQFAKVPLENCEETLAGIKALKAFFGFESNSGVVELEAQAAEVRKKSAEQVLNAIG